MELENSKDRIIKTTPQQKHLSQSSQLIANYGTLVGARMLLLNGLLLIV